MRSGLTVKPFSGPTIVRAKAKPVIDGQADDAWQAGKGNAITKKVYVEELGPTYGSENFHTFVDDPATWRYQLGVWNDRGLTNVVENFWKMLGPEVQKKKTIKFS